MTYICTSTTVTASNIPDVNPASTATTATNTTNTAPTIDSKMKCNRYLHKTNRSMNTITYIHVVSLAQERILRFWVGRGCPYEGFAHDVRDDHGAH